MESSSSTDDDYDEEDYNTFLYGTVHHSVEGVPEGRNTCVQWSNSPTISYCKVEQKVCDAGTVQIHTGDIVELSHGDKTDTLASGVRSKRTEPLNKGKESSKQQVVIDVVTLESSDSESESVVEVPVSGDSNIVPRNYKTDTLAMSIRNRRRFQHLNMVKESVGQECIVNVDDSDAECEAVVESVPAIFVGSCGDKNNMVKKGSCVLKGTRTKGKGRETMKKKQKKGLKETCYLDSISDYISPKSWNPEMRYFYNDSWGGENFDINELQKTMSGNPADWRVLEIDSVLHPRRTFSEKKRKCNNCNAWGHDAKFCPRPKKLTVCIFCGMRGHNKWTCPKPVCLNCGRHTKIYRASCDTCKNTRPCIKCNMTGHSPTACPDIWRKLYSVTSSEGLSAAASEVHYKPQKDQWCPNCGQRGHQFSECSLDAKKFYMSSESRNLLKHKLESPVKKNRIRIGGRPYKKRKQSDVSLVFSSFKPYYLKPQLQ